MSGHPRPFLRIERLTQRFGWLTALRDVNLSLARGEIVALLGANGSGKTTLLRLCAGLMRPSAGRILIGGWDLRNEAERVRAHLGYVGHQPLFDAALNPRENLQFFARIYGIKDARRVSDLLARVMPEMMVELPAGHLSRGRKQALSIARACLHEPDLLLLDEPLNHLDARAREQSLQFILETRARGGAILWATHQLESVQKLADRALVLREGELIHDIHTAMNGPQWAEVARLLAAGAS